MAAIVEDEIFELSYVEYNGEETLIHDESAIQRMVKEDIDKENAYRQNQKLNFYPQLKFVEHNAGQTIETIGNKKCKITQYLLMDIDHGVVHVLGVLRIVFGQVKGTELYFILRRKDHVIIDNVSMAIEHLKSIAGLFEDEKEDIIKKLHAFTQTSPNMMTIMYVNCKQEHAFEAIYEMIDETSMIFADAMKQKIQEMPTIREDARILFDNMVKRMEKDIFGNESERRPLSKRSRNH
jgi:hypothetical protein